MEGREPDSGWREHRRLGGDEPEWRRTGAGRAPAAGLPGTKEQPARASGGSSARRRSSATIRWSGRRRRSTSLVGFKSLPGKVDLIALLWAGWQRGCVARERALRHSHHADLHRLSIADLDDPSHLAFDGQRIHARRHEGDLEPTALAGDGRCRAASGGPHEIQALVRQGLVSLEQGAAHAGQRQGKGQYRVRIVRRNDRLSHLAQRAVHQSEGHRLAGRAAYLKRTVLSRVHDRGERWAAGRQRPPGRDGSREDDAQGGAVPELDTRRRSGPHHDAPHGVAAVHLDGRSTALDRLQVRAPISGRERLGRRLAVPVRDEALNAVSLSREVDRAPQAGSIGSLVPDGDLDPATLGEPDDQGIVLRCPPRIGDVDERQADEPPAPPGVLVRNVLDFLVS